MAICKTSPGIESLRGRFGGVYFKKDNAGQHVQAMPRSVRKASMESPKGESHSPTSRADNIGGFSMAAAWWLFLIVAASLASLWGRFSEMNPFKFEDKPPGRLPGYQWFIHFNVIRAARKRPPRAYPPKSPTDLPIATATSENPDLNFGNFYDDGTYNGRKLYKSQDGKWYTWWFDPSWIISPAPGQSEEPPYWFRLDESEFGGYQYAEPGITGTRFWDD